MAGKETPVLEDLHKFEKCKGSLKVEQNNQIE